MQHTHQHIIALLNALKDEGFVIGVDSHLQVWAILQSLPQDADTKTVVDFLCPLFSQSDVEQAKFHQVFKQYAHLLGLDTSAPQPETSDRNQATGDQKPVSSIQKPPRRSQYFFIGLLITAVIALASWLIYPYLIPQEVYGCLDKNALNYNPEATIDTADICQYPQIDSVCMETNAANYLDTAQLDTPEKIYVACTDCCIEKEEVEVENNTETNTPKPKPKQKAQKDSTTYIVPFEQREVNLPDLQPISGTFGYWMYQNKTPLAIALSILFLGLFIAKWLYDKKQDDYNAQRSKNTDPPYILPIKITNKKGIGFSEKMKLVFSQLRGREASSIQRINLPKTINATIKKGGFLDIRYRQQTRPSEYLILIDKNSELNHQAQLFEYIYQLIKQEEVQVSRYFYDDDIRYCWNEKYPSGIELERLTHLHTEARLMIFSDGYSFINRTDNEIQKWLKPVEHWSRRALITPAPMAGWNYREGILSQLFVILPANLQGFLEVVDHFETLKESDLKAWKYEIGKADKPLELSKEDFVRDLQRHFSPAMFRWIAACAVYPDLHWDLTIRIGHALSENGENLVTHTNLIELTRLRWFQRGYMTLSVREQLLENLSKDDQQKVRAVIVAVLEENIPDENSYAFREHQLQLAINKLLLDKIGEYRRKWLKIAEAMQQQGAATDPVSIEALKDKENRFLGFKLPERFVNFFFKGGIRTFGLENWAALTLLLVGLVGVWTAHYLIQDTYKNIVTLDNEEYSLLTAQDTVDFYILQEVWNWEQIANRSDKRSEVPLDWETALNNMEFPNTIEGLSAGTLNYHNKLNPILLAQYNAYVRLYDAAWYGNILQAHQNHQNHQPKPIFEQQIYSRFEPEGNIPVYNPFIQTLQLDILQLVGLAEFYTKAEPIGTAFTTLLASNRLTDSTRIAYTQSNVPNLYHLLQYDYVDSMVMNRVRVAKDEKYGFLDSLGNPTWTGTTLPYDYVSRYNADNKAVRLIGTEQCVIDKAEQVVDCFRKLTPYQNSNGKWGYVNENNTLIIDAEYDEARDFGENHVVVKKGNRYGMIDKSGTEVLPFDYTEIGDFVTNRNIARVRKGNRYGYISEDLSINIEPKYSRATNFEGTTNLTAAVTLDGKAIRINTQGECVEGCEVKYVIRGKVRNDKNIAISNVRIATTEYGSVQTNSNGDYVIEFEINQQLPLSVELTVDGGIKYRAKQETVTFTTTLTKTQNIVLETIPEQNRTVKGTITDKNTNSPIANATINVFDRNNDKNYTGTSNNQGQYTVDLGTNTKEYSISISKNGYATERRDMNQTTNNLTLAIALASQEILLIPRNVALSTIQNRVSKKYNPEALNESRDPNRKYYVNQGVINLGIVKINTGRVIMRVTDINANFDNSVGLETTIAVNETKYISYKNKVYQITLERINSPTLGRKTAQFEVIEWSENTPIPQTVFVKGGSFQMGSNDGRANEQPIHTVTIKDFNIGKYEVTVKEYLAFCEATNSNYPEWLEVGNKYHVETGTDGYYKNKGYSRTGSDNLPIVGVSWNNAKAYCKWLSETTGQTYRLPTEAEWEYAARGGNQSNGYKYSGSNNIDEVAWYNDNSGSKTHPVGTKKANELGIYDMSGNVWEWCEDKWHDNYQNAPTDGSAWLQNGDNTRVLRGGSWGSLNNYCRVASRNDFNPSNRSYSGGFRVVRGD